MKPQVTIIEKEPVDLNPSHPSTYISKEEEHSFMMNQIMAFGKSEKEAEELIKESSKEVA